MRYLLGWVVAAPFILEDLYVLSFPCFKILVQNSGADGVQTSPRMPLNSVASPRKQPHSPSEVRLKEM
ncbi:hypothetical protein CASFOL_014597 [Castilleja foliolosa]|uniref:Uncharacterized protein n=1 Tax=Castilleja foliolosa TaxID=1961234 RepID=A0ABD3DNY1_9LAMI